MKTLKLTLSVLAAIALGGCGGLFKGNAAAKTAIANFHDLYNQGNTGQIWTNATPAFCATIAISKFEEFMGAMQRKLGKVVSTTNAGWNVQSYNFTTTVAMAQDTIFEHGEGTERFNFTMNGTNAILSGYHIESMDLITK